MSGSDVEATFIEAATADRNGVCAAQTPGSATNLTINGALASGGSVTFDQPRQVTVYAAGNESAKSFTVTGTDETGTAATETITGPNATTVTGSTYFATVTQVASSAATGGDGEVGSGAGACMWLIQVQQGLYRLDKRLVLAQFVCRITLLLRQTRQNTQIYLIRGCGVMRARM